MQKEKHHLIIESYDDILRPHELSAARLLVDFFDSDIYFIRRGVIPTPDFRINGQEWELKSPTGNSERTIQNTMRDAKKQAKNLIIDLRRTNMTLRSAEKRVKNYAKKSPADFDRVIIITKGNETLDIYKRK